MLDPKVIVAAQKAFGKYGVPASVTLAQYCLESGYGKHMPLGSNNPFGIKANSPPYVEANTIEVIHGQVKHLVARFKKYPSLDEAFDDHARLLALGKPYQGIKPWLWQPLIYIRKLTGLYATDPDYGTKLGNIIFANNLIQYDVAIRSGPQTTTKIVGITAVGSTVALAVSKLPEKAPVHYAPDITSLLCFAAGILLVLVIAFIIHLTVKPKPQKGMNMILASFQPVIDEIVKLKGEADTAQATIDDLTNKLAAATQANTDAATNDNDTLAALNSAAGIQ